LATFRIIQRRGAKFSATASLVQGAALGFSYDYAIQRAGALNLSQMLGGTAVEKPRTLW
jgi:hypothetical protein